MKNWVIIGSAMILAACGGTDGETDAAPSSKPNASPNMGNLITQSFAIINTAGVEIGQVTITDQSTGGVMLDLDVTAIPQGPHAIHFHTNGSCDLPDFKSAEGHYNPMDANHGFQSTAPNPHAGDMPNFDAPASGVVKTQILNERVSLSDRKDYAPLFDADNTALIIHAGADDYVSQPTGAAGGRIACAVIAP
jgi:Cu-Zn family superoxide dismutase